MIDAAERESVAATQRVTVLPSLRLELARAAALFTVSVLLLVWIFPGNGVGLLALIALTPWVLAVTATHRAWIVYWLSFIAGWGFFLWALRWLMPVTGLGYTALAGYLAIYWVLAAFGVRTARRYGILSIWSLPVVWVACEYLRAWVMSGFPWLFLGHALFEQIWLIQISDITGAYGVSFIAAMISAAIAEITLQTIWSPPNRRHPVQYWLGLIGTAVFLVAVLGYGRQRMIHDPAAAPRGPKVAIVQEDFVLRNNTPNTDGRIVLAHYMALAAEAAQQKPDLLALPESPWGEPMNASLFDIDMSKLQGVSQRMLQKSRQFHEATAALARGDYAEVNRIIALLERQLQSDTGRKDTLPRIRFQRGPAVQVLVGATALIAAPPESSTAWNRSNSAFFYDSNGKQLEKRYDKIHLVPFGEAVPFRHTAGLRWLYLLLNKLSPFSDNGRFEYSLTPGDSFHTFDLHYAAGVARFGVPICYEDVMPYVSRSFVWDWTTRKADFLVNISNDGWFVHSHELPQHLAICVFRAVENRVSIARAVNTGISAFIDPDGRITRRVERDGVSHGPGIIGYAVEDIVLDRRDSLYGQIGDLFARICLVLASGLWLQGIVTRWILALRTRIIAWRTGRKRVVPPESS